MTECGVHSGVQGVSKLIEYIFDGNSKQTANHPRVFEYTYVLQRKVLMSVGVIHYIVAIPLVVKTA